MSERGASAAGDDRLVVALTTHGGLAAGVATRRAPRVVDTEGLAAAEAGELRRLVAVAQAVAQAEAQAHAVAVAQAQAVAEAQAQAEAVAQSRAQAEAPATGSGHPAPVTGGGHPVPGTADLLSYTVTVERGRGTAGGRTVLTADDLTLTDALADLVTWVEEHAPPHRQP